VTRRGPGHPPKPPAEKRVNVTVRLPGALVERLDAVCQAEGYTRTEYVERAVEERLAKKGR
jgi:metal-responsive CopG/Arc/MetJ family transcriptional regulator